MKNVAQLSLTQVVIMVTDAERLNIMNRELPCIIIKRLQTRKLVCALMLVVKNMDMRAAQVDRHMNFIWTSDKYLI